MNYIFLDEIQNVKDFQRVVDSLFIKDHVDIYITGSNAYLLSGELATLLSGRYMTIHMLPLSFLEYSKAFPEKEKYVAYNDYINNSSFPFTINLEANQVSDYMENIYDTIVLKDIISRKNFSDSM